MKKGFTLVELLAIITIMGLIALIAIPTVVTMIKNSRKDLCETEVKNIISSAKNWAGNNMDLLPEENESITVSIETLKEKGYLSSDLNNPLNGELIEDQDRLEVTIYNNKGNLEYSFKDICTNKK